MDIFVARQPIFDRNLKIYGYELLYRNSEQNFFAGIDEDRATEEVIYNSFLVMGLNDLTDDTLAFINFSKVLIDSDAPYLLPPESVIVEVLEGSDATQATIEACKRLKEKGYTIALDDFVPDEANMPLVEFADIIKLEFPYLPMDDQERLLDKYGTKIKFLAEKIETREDYNKAVEMGYKYFQGYFFSKPTIVSSKEIESLNVNILRIMGELNNKEPRFESIARIVECDLGLSYKILRLVNSAYFGSRHSIKSIPNALTYLGLKELYQWFSLMLLKDVQNVENAEMIKISLIRGKLMELLAAQLRGKLDKIESFFTGVFSSIDVLMNKPMEQVLETLPFTAPVKKALLGEDNEYRRLLDCVISSESVEWVNADNSFLKGRISVNKFMDLYLESLRWAQMLNYK